MVKLYLDPAYGSKGIGKQLLEMNIDSAKKMRYRQIYLESLPELKKAVSLYEKQVFRYIDYKMGDSGHFGCTILMLKDI